MALDAMIFDIDGTLIDSNPAHVEAWRLAFESLGYRIAPDRIEIEIGKGGDKLVQMPRIVGQILAQESRTLFEEFLKIATNPQQREFTKQLLALT